MKAILFAIALAGLFSFSVPWVAAADEKEEVDEKEFRKFTAKNGKSIEARVVARIDDERYTVESRDGKRFTLNTGTLSKSDADFLFLWEPDAILDLKTAGLEKVLEKIGYSMVELTSAGTNSMFPVTVGGQEYKFVLGGRNAWSILDTKVATDLGLTLSQGNVNFTLQGGGQERSQQGTVKTLAIGETELEDQSLQVIDVGKVSSGLPAAVSGILGSDHIKKFNSLIDLSGKRLFVRADDSD